MNDPNTYIGASENPQAFHLAQALGYIWDTNTLTWTRATASAASGAVTIADGADVAEGATTDAAVSTDTTGTVSGKLRGLVKWSSERMPAALGQTTMSASLPVALASNQSSIPVAGDVAHDGVDSGNPVKIGAKAIGWGSSPTNVAAADRTDLYATLGGIQYVLATHPNVITRRDNYTTAQTNTAVVAATASTKIVVLEATIITDAACTAKPSAILGFHATTTPTGAGVVVSHPGISPGSGISTRTPVASASADALLLTCAVPTGGSLTVLTKYYTTGA